MCRLPPSYRYAVFQVCFVSGFEEKDGDVGGERPLISVSPERCAVLANVGLDQLSCNLDVVARSLSKRFLQDRKSVALG